MKKLDLRTLIVALAIFALGFATCAVVVGAAVVKADPGEIEADRYFVRDYIQFLDNRVKLIAVGDALACEGPFDPELLWGYALEDFVLKSEIDDDFCKAFCPIILKSE